MTRPRPVGGFVRRFFRTEENAGTFGDVWGRRDGPPGVLLGPSRWAVGEGMRSDEARFGSVSRGVQMNLSTGASRFLS